MKRNILKGNSQMSDINQVSRNSVFRAFRKNLMGGTAIVAVVAVGVAFGVTQSQKAQAADISANLEAAGADTGNTTVDTFVIDATNDGEPTSSALTFGAGTTGLTVSSDGLDASDTADTGQITSITTADNTGTNTLTLNDATNGDNLTLVITGNISGDVGIAANDLDTIINALSTNDGGDTTLDLNGNVTVGTGTITLTGDVNDTPTLLFSGTTAQTSDAAVVVTTDGFGILSVTNPAGVTISDIIGVAGNGLESITIASGASLTQKLGVTTAGTFDVVGNVDDGSGARGGTLVIEAGDAATTDRRRSRYLGDDHRRHHPHNINCARWRCWHSGCGCWRRSHFARPHWSGGRHDF